MFEYVFGSKRYALYVKVLGVSVPMGLYNRFVPESFKSWLIKREREQRRAIRPEPLP